MLIVCPSCATSYAIGEGLVPAEGRAVRCAACDCVWLASAEDEQSPGIIAAEVEALSAAAVDDYDALYGTPELPGPASEAPTAPPSAPLWRRAMPAIGIVASLAAAMALIGLRGPIARMAPAARPLYAAIGLPVKAHGLALRALRTTLEDDGDKRVLAVEGEIVNPGGAAKVPQLAVAVRAQDGREIYTWTADAPKAKIAAGETLAFRTRLAAPPEGGSEVSVRFAGVP